MALVAAKSADKQLSHSFGSLLEQLDARSGQLIPPSEAFLVEHADVFQRAADPFGSPDAASKAKVDSGSGKIAALSFGQHEKELSLQIASRFAINEVEAALLLRSLRLHLGEEVGKDIEASRSKDDGFSETVTAFFFEERLAIVQVLSYILRSVDTEGDVPQIYTTIVSQVSTRSFAQSALKRIAHLASTSISAQANPYTTYWAKQQLREQKALLEVYFLLHYNKLFPNGQTLLDILETAEQTEWGRNQVNEAYHDGEAQALVRDITSLLILVAIESLNLERAASSEAEELNIVPSAKLEPYELLHPAMLSQIHHRVLDLGASQPQATGPLLLAWSFVLSRITESMTAVPLPESYYEIAAELLPQEMHPRRNTQQVTANRSAQPVYQTLVSHALSSDVALFSTLHNIFVSPLLGSASVSVLATGSSSPDALDPNVPGYLSVARSILAVTPLLVHPSFLSATDFEALVIVMASLYSNPAAGLLRGQFWGLYDQPDAQVVRGEWEVLEVAKSRFPVQIGPFLQLIGALTGGAAGGRHMTIDEAETARGCSERVRQYLGSVPTLTQALPPTSPVVPLPYEASSAVNASPLDVVSLRSIPVSPSVSVPAHVPGRFVSDHDRRPVVIAWDLSYTAEGGYSAWRLMGDMLDAFVGSRKSAQQSGRKRRQASDGTVDVFGGNRNEGAPTFAWQSEAEQVSDISAVLSIFRDVTSQSPLQVEEALVLLSDTSPEDTVQTMLSVLEKALSIQPTPTSISVPATQILQALLGSYPSQVWHFLRASGVLIPLAASGSSAPSWGSRPSAAASRFYLAQDRNRGSYEQTLATIDLLSALIRQAQITTLVDTVAQSELKSDVLVRSFRWIIDSVWTSFGSWRFLDVRQKFALGSGIIGLFLSILSDVDCGRDAICQATASSARVVLQALLAEANPTKLSPLLTFIASGFATMTQLHRAGQQLEAAACEQCTIASLSVVTRLLSLSRRVLPNEPSLLEKLLLSHSSDKSLQNMLSTSSQDVISLLFKYIHATPVAGLGIGSARLLSELCRLSVDWGHGSERPSILGHLGGVKETQNLVRSLIGVAGDPFVDANLQTAVWTLMTDIVDSQPGLADVLISGQKTLVQLLDPSAKADAADSNTGVALAVQVLQGWEEAWEVQPELLSAALTFLSRAWEGYIESNVHLHTVRKDGSIWSQIGRLLGCAIAAPAALRQLESAEIEAETATELRLATERYCHKKMAKAAALRLLATDARYAASTTDPSGSIALELSLKTLSEQVADVEAFATAVIEATSSTFDPSLHDDTRSAFSASFKNLQLQDYQRPLLQLETPTRAFGPNYFYDVSALQARFEGLASELEGGAVDNAVKRAELLNYSMSMLEADSRALAAWCELLEGSLPHIPESQTVGDSLGRACQEVTQRIAGDDRMGEIAEEMHGERLRLVKTMMEYATRRTVAASPDILSSMVETVRSILTNEYLSPLESLRHQKSTYHQPAFQIAYLLYGRMSAALDVSTTTSKAGLLAETETTLGVAFSAVQICLLLAGSSRVDPSSLSGGILEDFALCTSLVEQILSATAVPPRTAVWVAYCRELDLFRGLVGFISSSPLRGGHAAMLSDALNLVLALSAVPSVAEKLAIEGLVSALNNNALTSLLEGGSLQLAAPRMSEVEAASEDMQMHRIWCTMQAVMTQLVVHLGSSVPFMETEVAAFSRLYSQQLVRCFRWTANDPLTIPTMTEMQHTASLLSSVVATRTSVQALQPLLRKQVNAALALLQQLVYLLQHPNLLSTLLEPMTPEEKTWLAGEDDSDANISLNDLHKRPVAASILQEVLKISHIIIASLVTYCSCFTVVGRDSLDWPKDRALVPPTANVSLDEPATLGTLFDLARFCTDVARYCNTTAAASPAASRSPPLPAYAASPFVELANITLEGTLLLMSTQIALTVQQQDAQAAAVGYESRQAQRARRDLKELAGDLVEEFLDRPNQAAESRLLEVLKTFVTRL